MAQQQPLYSEEELRRLAALRDEMHVAPAQEFPAACYSWMKNEEVAALLLSFENHDRWLHRQPVAMPPSGSVWLFQRKMVNFRKDLHVWERRAKSGALREDHTKLKLNSIERIYSCYAHSPIMPGFDRRGYWLLTHPDIILVHYLNARNVHLTPTVTLDATAGAHFHGAHRRRTASLGSSKDAALSPQSSASFDMQTEQQQYQQQHTLNLPAPDLTRQGPPALRRNSLPNGSDGGKRSDASDQQPQQQLYQQQEQHYYNHRQPQEQQQQQQHSPTALPQYYTPLNSASDVIAATSAAAATSNAAAYSSDPFFASARAGRPRAASFESAGRRGSAPPDLDTVMSSAPQSGQRQSNAGAQPRRQRPSLGLLHLPDGGSMDLDPDIDAGFAALGRMPNENSTRSDRSSPLSSAPSTPTMARLCDLAQLASDVPEDHADALFDGSQLEASLDMFSSRGDGSPSSLGSGSLSGYLARRTPAGADQAAAAAAAAPVAMETHSDTGQHTAAAAAVGSPRWQRSAARAGGASNANLARQDIVALAPEWASLSGGTLVLIVGPWEPLAENYSVRIGTEVVAAKQLQAGVLACHTPPMMRSYNTSLEVWKGGVPVSLPVPFAFCRLDARHDESEPRGSPLPSHEGSPRLARAFSPGPPPSMTVEVDGPVSSALGVKKRSQHLLDMTWQDFLSEQGRARLASLSIDDDDASDKASVKSRSDIPSEYRAAKTIQGAFRRYKLQRHMSRERAAALIIQQSYRRYKNEARQRREREEAARIIQRRFRTLSRQPRHRGRSPGKSPS